MTIKNNYSLYSFQVRSEIIFPAFEGNIKFPPSKGGDIPLFWNADSEFIFDYGTPILTQQLSNQYE